MPSSSPSFPPLYRLSPEGQTAYRQISFLSNRARQQKQKEFNTKLQTLMKQLRNGSCEALQQANRWLDMHRRWIALNDDEREASHAFCRHFEQIEFLFQKRLFYAIELQYHCSSDLSLKQQHTPICEEEGGLSIRARIGGRERVKVSELIERFTFNRERNCLVNSLGQSWNYFSRGFEQIDRWQSDDFPPVAHISAQEQQLLLEHGRKFWTQAAHSDYELRREPHHRAEEDRCIVQVFMSPHKVLKNPHYALLPMHAGIRLIDEQGQVYSTGFGATPTENKRRQTRFNWLATVNGTPTLMDQDEGRVDDGRVTVSLSISIKQKEQILKQLKRYRTQGIRFNIVAQNCTRLAADILGMSGVEVDNRTHVILLTIGHYLPSKLHQTARKVYLQWRRLHPAIRWTLSLAAIPSILVYRLLLNLLMIGVGGAGSGTPVRHPAAARSQPASQGRLASFRSLIGRVKDLCRDPFELYHSTPLMRWMLAQSTAWVARYKGKSDMRLHPPKQSDSEAALESQQDLERLRELYQLGQREVAPCSLGSIVAKERVARAPHPQQGPALCPGKGQLSSTSAVNRPRVSP